MASPARLIKLAGSWFQQPIIRRYNIAHSMVRYKICRTSNGNRCVAVVAIVGRNARENTKLICVIDIICTHNVNRRVRSARAVNGDYTNMLLRLNHTYVHTKPERTTRTKSSHRSTRLISVVWLPFYGWGYGRFYYLYGVRTLLSIKTWLIVAKKLDIIPSELVHYVVEWVVR